jgi:vitamin B12 transporter
MVGAVCRNSIDMTQIARKSLAGTWLTLFAVGAALAQNPTLPPPERTVVTVTARPVPLQTTAADITVQEPDVAASSSPLTMADLLRLQPGIHVTQAGQRGGLTTVGIRGGDPNFTLLLLDGVPANDITDQLGGTVDLGSILPLLPARVEIVRGAMSSVYGSEAVSGVVNLITETKGMPHASVEFGGGSFGTVSGGVQLGWWRPRFSVAFGGAGLRIGEQVRGDSFLAGDNLARVDVYLRPDTLLTLTGRLGKHEVKRYPTSSGGPLYALNPALESVDGDRLFGGLNLRHSSGRWWESLAVDSGLQRADQDTPAIFDRIPPSYSTVPATRSATRFTRHRVQGVVSRELSPGWSATGGASYRYEDGENVGSIDGLGPADYRLERTTRAIFAETVLERKGWSLVAAVRSDWAGGEAHRASPRVGASVRTPWKGGRVRASVGKGFKMPSFYALGQPMVGNRGLKPETSSAADAGLEQSLGKLGTTGANVFRSAYRDLIDFSPGEFRLVNRSAAVSRGVDVWWRRTVLGMAIQTHGTYSASYLRNSVEPVRNAPRWRTGATVTRSLRNRASLHLEGRWVASSYDYQVPITGKDVAPSYLVVNAAAQVAVRGSVSATVRVDNVLNRCFQEYVGFPNPGIAVRAGIRYTIR